MAALAARDGERSVEVWPENWKAFELFYSLRTQWNVGFAGPTGLRYEAAYPLIDRATQTVDEWDELFEDLRALEQGALAKMREDRAD